MGEALVRFEGAQEVILDRLTELGIYKTRSEAIRAGVLEIGKEFKVFKDIKDLEDELAVRKMMKIDREIKEGKKKVFSKKEVAKKYSFE